jgi:hypothetical protein
MSYKLIYLNENAFKKIKSSIKTLKDSTISLITKVKNALGINPSKLAKYEKEAKKLKEKSKELNESTESTESAKSSNVKKAKAISKIKGEINAIDSCFTAIMKLAGKDKIIDLTKGSLGLFIKKYYDYFGEPIKITKQNVKYLKKGHIITVTTNLPNDKNYKKVTGEYNIATKFDEKHGLMRTGYRQPYISTEAHMMIILDPKDKIILHNGSTFSGKANPPGSKLALQVEKITPVFDDPEKLKIYLYDLKLIDKLIKKLEEEKKKFN